MSQINTDTIVALSTPLGVGATGVIRISGPKAVEIVDLVFYGKNLKKVAGNTVHYGKIKDLDGNVIDECLATVFLSPRSYTKEDVVELSCHGSPYILQRVIQILIENGARTAEAGEFTLRAFLNGQLDLAQAEAVADLIESENAQTHLLAINQMRGGFSKEIADLRQDLIDFAALVELELDFGEEDVEFADKKKLKDLVVRIKQLVTKLLESFELGNVMKNGVTTVLAGRPNAGKSTLLNALLNEDRAIVSEIAGTTRDTIEESLNIRGVQFKLIDTAGIRETQSRIEQLGVDRTIEKISKSTIVIYLFDVTTSAPDEVWNDIETFLSASVALKAKSKQLFVANKMDLFPNVVPSDYYKDGLISENNLITLSAKNRMNIEYLKEKIFKLVISDTVSLNQTIVTNTRHVDALSKTNKSLEDVLNGLHSGISGDMIALDIRQALYFLGLITGEVSSEDLLESIFSRFCIGK